MLDSLECHVCHNSNVDHFEIDAVDVDDSILKVGWVCKQCGVPHWADFQLVDGTLDFDDTAYEPPETYWTHPSLTASERNPGLR